MDRPAKAGRIRFAVLLAALTGSGCATSPEPASHALDRFVEIFPGRYDSDAQHRDEAARGVPEAQRNYRRHSIFRRVDLPAFGDVVFLAHQYRDGNPTKIYRQRLYTLWKDGDGFVLRVHVPKDGDALADAYRDPSRLAGLTPDDFTVWDGCDLSWHWDSDRFVGSLTPGACRFTSAAFGQEIVLEETLTLSEDGMTFADRGLSLDGEWLFGMRGDTPNISRRVQPFLCEAGGRTAWLHDQGGTSESLGHPVRLERDDALRLAVTLEGQGDRVATADRDAQTIAMDLEAGTLTCRHAPDTLYTETTP